jgi:hypothetical protein
LIHVIFGLRKTRTLVKCTKLIFLRFGVTFELHRMSYLKSSPNYFTRSPSHIKRQEQWEYWITAAISRCCSWCTVLNRYGCTSSWFVFQSPFVTDEHIQCPEVRYKSLCCCLIWHFIVEIRIDKCSTNSSKRFYEAESTTEVIQLQKNRTEGIKIKVKFVQCLRSASWRHGGCAGITSPNSTLKLNECGWSDLHTVIFKDVSSITVIHYRIIIRLWPMVLTYFMILSTLEGLRGKANHRDRVSYFATWIVNGPLPKTMKTRCRFDNSPCFLVPLGNRKYVKI